LVRMRIGLSTSLRAQAKQSILSLLGDNGLLRGACHRGALRADPLARNDVVTFRFKFQTADTHLRSRGGRRPSFACRCPSNRREQGMPDARCTRGLACKLGKGCAHEHTGQRRTSDIPCAMALRLISRSPRSIGLFSPPSPPGNRRSGPVGLSHLRKT
jgi:hypothetical protein